MSEQVNHLIAMAEQLTEERVVLIADAYRKAGFPHVQFSQFAATKEDRHIEATAAMHDVAIVVNLFGMLHDSDPIDLNYAAWAAKNVGYGVATEDLIGIRGYSIHEYARLVDPWFAGFADLPMEEREGIE